METRDAVCALIREQLRLGRKATMSATFNDVRQILQRWDKGSKSVRCAMLKDFVEQCESMTAPELEQQFSDCASLFLARLTACLRLAYMGGAGVQLLLRAIGVFTSASSGQHFLTEFLEVGGVLTLLEIIGLRTAKEEDKIEAIRLLTSIAEKGRQYKELLCESYGVKVLAECLALSTSEETKDCARILLHQLSSGNPRYQSQVYKALISLLSSTSPEAQRMAAYTLRQIQPSMGVVSVSIVEPCLQLLRSLHVDVQYQALELLSELVGYEEVQQSILFGLVGLLKAADSGSNPAAVTGSEGAMKVPLPIHIQQAGAAKAIGALASSNAELAERLVELEAVPHLLFAMGNTAYADSQKQAAIALTVFVKQFASVKQQTLSVMGEEFFAQLMRAPGQLYEVLTPSQIDVLVASLGLEGGMP